MAIKISAINHYFPSKFRTNTEIEQILKINNPAIAFTSGLIEKITGIQTRPLAEVDEFSSTLAVKATQKLFQNHKIDKSEIDLLIFASATQDLLEPATSHIIQSELGTNAHCFDIKNACNSFLNGLEVGCSLLNSGSYKKALIVVGEKPSVTFKEKLRDRLDFKNSFAGYTFGDSGASVLLEKSKDENQGIFFQQSISLSKYWDVGTLPGGGTRNPRGDEFTYFQGGGYALKDAFSDLGPAFLQDCLDKVSLNYTDFQSIFIHQVSKSFLDEFIKASKIPKEKVLITINKYGNLAAATLPVSLSMCIENGDVKTGDKVLLIGLAGGISLGVTMIQL